MYAVSHAATALPINRLFPRARLWTLLIAVQAIELLWVVFTYVGIEHIDVSGDQIHLGFLPYSHSVGSTLIVAALAWAVIRGVTHDSRFAAAIAIGIVSHIVLDIIQHESDIRLLPVAIGPRLGLGLTLHPIADVFVETGYGVLCWQLFGGSWALLAGLVALNVLNIPFMFPNAGSAATIARQPAILTTVVLVQILVSWVVVWALARRRSDELSGVR